MKNLLYPLALVHGDKVAIAVPSSLVSSDVLNTAISVNASDNEKMDSPPT